MIIQNVEFNENDVLAANGIWNKDGTAEMHLIVRGMSPLFFETSNEGEAKEFKVKARAIREVIIKRGEIR